MPKIVDKDAKKVEILQAAIKIFARKGVIKTKMADIASAAGVGKGTIYEYFRSKEDIFAEAFAFIYKSMKKTLKEALEKTDDPAEKLRILTEQTLVNLIEDEEDLAGIMTDFWAEGIRNKDTQILKIIDLEKVYKEYREMISEILKDGIEKGFFKQMDTLALSAILIAVLDGLMLQWIMNRELFDIRAVSRTLLESFLYGIKKSDRYNEPV